MKLLKKKDKEKEEPEEDKEKRSRSKKNKPLMYEKPRDPTRWLSILFLLIFLFLSYLSWVAYK